MGAAVSEGDSEAGSGPDANRDPGSEATTRLYHALVDVVIASKDAVDIDVAMTAIAQLLLDTGKAARIPAAIVLATLAQMAGGNVHVLRHPRGQGPGSGMPPVSGGN